VLYYLSIISEITSGANNDFIETLGRITMVIALGIPLSLCTKLFFERIEGYKKVSRYTSYIVCAVLLVFLLFLPPKRRRNGFSVKICWF